MNGRKLSEKEIINKVHVYRFDIGQDLFKRNVGDIKSYIDFVISYPKDILILECIQCHTTDILLPYLDQLKCKKIIHSHGGPGLNMKPFGWEGDVFHTIGHIHNWYRWKKYYNKTLRNSLKNIDAVLCLSLCASDLQYMYKHAKKTFILENAADDLFFTEDAYKLNVNDILNIKQKEYILCISNYIPNKSQIEILKAYNSLPIENKCPIVFIGSKQTKYYHSLYKFAQKISDINNNNIYMLTNVDRQYFPSLIYHSKFFVMASIHEEYPVSLVEAMAVGKVFVSTDAGCSRLLPGGVTVVRRSLLSLFMNIINNDDDMRKTLGNLGKEYAKNNNSKNKIITKLESILNSL